MSRSGLEAMVRSSSIMEMVDSDFDLVERWATGDGSAGDELTRRHYKSVFRFFEVRLPGQAEDLTQRTFLACVEALKKRSLHTSFRSYLFGIARNHVLMHLRRSATQSNALASFGDDGQRPSRQTSLTAVFARTEEQQLLLAALVDLPPDLQISMQLYYWDNMSTAEIGEVFSIPPSTVTTRLARARHLIREHLVAIRATPPIQAALEADLPAWTRSLVSPEPPSV